MTFLRVKVSFSQIASLYALCYDTKKQRKGEHIDPYMFSFSLLFRIVTQRI